MIKTRDVVVCIICILLVSTGTMLWVDNNAQAKAVEYWSEDSMIWKYKLVTVDTSSFEEAKKFADAFIAENPIDQGPKTVEITMNFAGDCTLGTDTSFGYANQFTQVFDEVQDYGYFFKNMQSLFAYDDVTVVNLEGPLTEETKKTPKAFNFKGPAHYANILLSGDIDVVNLANNHTQDYGQKGYEDTLQALNDYGMPYFGYDNYYIYEKDGIKIGFMGLTGIWLNDIYQRIDTAINYLKENECDYIVATFHWGVEREYAQNSTQRRVGQYTIDKGADFVVGHHAHVVQGIEEYNGKYIVYGLGNFCFGGNTNPLDKDCMVFNLKLRYEDGELASQVGQVYPARVSSVNNRNNYQPTLAEGEEFTRILNKIMKYSKVKTDENGVIIE